MQKKTRKHYTAEFKATMVKEMLREEKTVGQLAAEYGIHPNMLYRWRDQALAGLPSVFDERTSQEFAEKEAEWLKEREALYAEIGRLTTQLTWLEKNLVHSLSRVQRSQLIDWENKELTVKTQAMLLGLNRSGLYYVPASPSPEEVALKHRIDKIYTAHPYYGYRRIAGQLHREGETINQKTVARYMQEMGLTAVYPGPNLSKRDHQAAIYPYLLANITANAPNHIWGIDITYIRLRGGWMYLVAVLDWYSRYVVSWLRHEVASVAVEADKQHSTWCSTTSILPRPASGVIPGWEALGTMYPFSSKNDGTVRGHRNCEHQCS